ncbi:MAG: tol-pal system protein YbgF [Amaricoccus sp.]
MRWLAGFGLALLVVAGPVAAADQNVADIQAELTLLNAQIDQLRKELVKQGPARGLPVAPATALTRLDQLQDELKRLTNRVDVLSNDIGRIVDEASNRVGDIDFRLTEIEGGDTSQLGKPAPLGGGLSPAPRPAPPATGASEPVGDAQLTVTERSDFDAAIAAAKAGDQGKAADLFASFLATYPGGPLSSEAQFRRGEALAAQSDWKGAAHSYLDSFSGAPEGPFAPRALFRLGVSLGKIGQVEQACLTLAEVDNRYPSAGLSGDVAREKQGLGCQ